MRTARLGLVGLGLGPSASLSVLCFVLLWPVRVSAGQAPEAQEAPVPSAISTAKKVFISNAGADSGLFPHPFSGRIVPTASFMRRSRAGGATRWCPILRRRIWFSSCS